MTTLVNGGRQRIPLDRIAIGDNVRELDADHVDALAASIKLRGLVVPVIVRVAGDGYELVAGFHRFAAHKKLGEASIDAEVRDVDSEPQSPATRFPDLLDRGVDTRLPARKDDDVPTVLRKLPDHGPADARTATRYCNNAGRRIGRVLGHDAP